MTLFVLRGANDSSEWLSESSQECGIRDANNFRKAAGRLTSDYGSAWLSSVDHVKDVE